MAGVDVTATDERTYRVVVDEDGDVSEHEVTVPEGYPERLGVADADLDHLVRASFAFLLEREPKEQILSRFELPVIAEYFSDYEEAIADRVEAG